MFTFIGRQNASSSVDSCISFNYGNADSLSDKTFLKSAALCLGARLKSFSRQFLRNSI